MRWIGFVVLCVALVACGSVKVMNGDAGVDAPRADAPVGSDAPPGTTLTLTNYGASGPVNAQLVAVQDGGGAWTVVSGSAGVYTAKVQADHFGLMVACAATMSSGVLTIYAAVADGTSWYVQDCRDPAPAAATIKGTVANAAPAERVRVLNGFDQVDLPAGTTSYTLGTTSSGPSTLFAEQLDASSRPVKLATVNATVTDGATINFDLGTGVAPAGYAVTASGAIASSSLAYRDLHEIVPLDHSVSDYRAVPSSQLGNGLDRLSVAAAGMGTTSQYVIRYFTNPFNQTITFPPALQLAQQPTATAIPYPTVSAMLPVQAGATLYDFDFSTDDQTSLRGWTTVMTGAYVAKAITGNTIAYTMPDFHGLAGWQASFQLASGQPITFSMDAQANANIDLFNAVPPTQFAFHDGGEERVSSITGQLTAP